MLSGDTVNMLSGDKHALRRYYRNKWLNGNYFISFSHEYISNQSIVNQNYIKSNTLVSTVNFHVQSAVSWKRSIDLIHKYTYLHASFSALDISDILLISQKYVFFKSLTSSAKINGGTLQYSIYAEWSSYCQARFTVVFN